MDKEVTRGQRREMSIYEDSCTLSEDEIKKVCEALMKWKEEYEKTVEENFEEHENDISDIKEQIKHSKNPLEIKILNRKLNLAYKNSKTLK